MKKFFAVVLAVVMALSMTAVAFAANDGQITITNATEGQTYTVYKIFDLASYNDETGEYAYTVVSDWADFVNDDDIKDVFVSVDSNGNVTWCADESDAAEFAKLAKEYADANDMAGTKFKKADGETVTITGLSLGYYLVDSTVGTLCSLDTTNKEVEIADKNEQPTLEKEVKEDSTETWGEENDAEIGETVEYKITVTKQAGAINYVVHDTMDAGLTFNADSVVVTVGDDTLTAGEDYTLTAPATVNTVTETFTLAIANAVVDAMEDGDTIVITYSAVVNEDAVIYESANENDALLKYGENNDLETEKDTTKTYVYKFDLVKTNASDVVLEGAEFELYADEDCTTKIGVIKEGDIYRVAVAGETAEVIVAGEATIAGLDSDTYYLKETKAPAGFNKLTDPVPVTIDGANLEASVEEGQYVEGGVQVVNQSGTELPSTGGIGTTIFYVVGMILVAGAAILLVSRRRMATVA